MENGNLRVITHPNSKEAEMMVLGCVLTNINSLSTAVESLDYSDLYFTEHQLIFHVLKEMYKSGKPADIHLVCEELKHQGKLKQVGGVAYITTLAQYAGTSAHIEEYVKTLRQYTANRRLIEVGQKLVQRGLTQEDSFRTNLEAQEALRQIERGSSSTDKFPIKFLNTLDKNYLLAEPPKKPMLLEYVNEANFWLGYLPKSIVGMLIGAGGIGKTHLLAQLAVAVATGTPWLDKYHPAKDCGENKKGNVFFGLGENQSDDIQRVLYKASKRLRQHQLDFHEEDLIVEASKRIAPFSFCGQQAAFIEDKKPSRYFREFKRKLIDIAPKEGWSLILLDPISRLLGADAETDNASATQFIALLEELIIDLPGNPTILFAHHVNKASMREGKEKGNQDQSAARGSSALTDGVRWQVGLTRAENNIILSMNKTNFTKFMSPITLFQEQDGYLAIHNNSEYSNISSSQLKNSGKINAQRAQNQLMPSTRP